MSIGPLTSAVHVERGIVATLRSVLPVYIGAACAELGLDRFAVPDPQDIQRLARPDQLVQGEQVGTLVVATAGTPGDARREGERYSMAWEVVCGIVSHLGDPFKTRDAAQIYAAAIGSCLAHQGCSVVQPGTFDPVTDEDGQLVTLPGSHVWLLNEQYSPLPDQPDLWMGGAAVMVRVDGARSVWGGPEQVPDVDDDGFVVRESLVDGEPTDIVPGVTVHKDPLT